MNNNTLIPFLKRVLAATLVVLAVLSLLYFGYLARKMLIWIGISGFLAVAINPIVHKLQRFMPRKSLVLATLLYLLILSAITIGLVLIFFAPLVQQTVKLISSIPELVNKLNSLLAKSPLSSSLELNKQSLESFLESNSGQIINSISQLGQMIMSFIAGIIDSAVAFITIISLMFFMTVEGKSLKSFSTRLLAVEHRAKAVELGHKVYDIINGYVVGNFIVSMIFGALSGLVLWLLHSPYYLVLALVAGLIDLIPLVGTTIAAILVTIVSVLSGQPWVGIIYIVFSIVYVQFENSVINPAVYSNKVSVSPLIVLIAILIGAAVAGILGALLAIPVAATLRVLVKDLFKDRLEAA